MKSNNHKIHNTKVLVIGCGGAGLRAAIEIKLKDIDVCILGKRKKKDAHTVLAAGGINASFGNLDPEDSWKQHFVDTYIEGYELGDPHQIEIMAKEAPQLVDEIDKWGANFARLNNGKLDQRFFGAHKYRRTCYSGDFTGFSILNTLLEKASSLNIPIFDSQYVTDLLIQDKICFGAMAINTKSLDRTVYYADAVILCTGGHTRLWEQSSSRKGENTGDGYHLALKAGCELIDMEMVQFHPSGMVFPKEIAGTLVTEAVRGEGGILINNNGERFMVNYDKDRMELSTRDKVAIANYTEISEGRGTVNGGVFLDISHKDKDLIMQKLPKIYAQFLDWQGLDISKEPMEVAPTAHYSMGGIKMNAEDHSTNIQGLFAAGEVSGGLHGANRLGGNSLAEILVFGRRAGLGSISYSEKLKKNLHDLNIVNKAHLNINKLIKEGRHSPKDLQTNLHKIMWKYCGVLKNSSDLDIALSKIKDIQNQFENINLRESSNLASDLVQTLDLQSSLVTSEATILSAIARKESRGAFQRKDYKATNLNSKFNTLIRMNEKDYSLYLTKKPVKFLSKRIKKLLEKREKLEVTGDKLLE